MLLWIQWHSQCQAHADAPSESLIILNMTPKHILHPSEASIYMSMNDNSNVSKLCSLWLSWIYRKTVAKIGKNRSKSTVILEERYFIKQQSAKKELSKTCYFCLKATPNTPSDDRFHPEDGGSMDIRNVGNLPQHYMVS